MAVNCLDNDRMRVTTEQYVITVQRKKYPGGRKGGVEGAVLQLLICSGKLYQNGRLK